MRGVAWDPFIISFVTGISDNRYNNVFFNGQKTTENVMYRF